MLKNLIDTTGYGVFGVISTVMFFAMFVAMIVYVLRMPKNRLDEAGRMPLDASDEKNPDREA
jgi:cbb3-type cytochrome oxidase subunit 3